MFLAGQVNPEDTICVYNSYLDETQEPHGYLLLDLTQRTNDGLRFRTNVFPNDATPLATYSYVGDEAREIKLSLSPGAEDDRTEIA